jgi:hypothetical protein
VNRRACSPRAARAGLLAVLTLLAACARRPQPTFEYESPAITTWTAEPAPDAPPGDDGAAAGTDAADDGALGSRAADDPSDEDGPRTTARPAPSPAEPASPPDATTPPPSAAGRGWVGHKPW